MHNEGNKMLRKSIFFECTFCLKQNLVPPLPSNFFDKLPFIFIPLILILLSWLFFSHQLIPILGFSASLIFSHLNTHTHTHTFPLSLSLSTSQYWLKPTKSTLPKNFQVPLKKPILESKMALIDNNVDQTSISINSCKKIKPFEDGRLVAIVMS